MIDVRLENVTISNFRSFGPVPIATAMASEITAMVGPNAAGTTALLNALDTLRVGRNETCSDHTFTIGYCNKAASWKLNNS